jgi:adenylylsulfate kinase
VLLDGDEVRAALAPGLGYDEDARARFYAVLAELAALLAGQGVAVLVAATAHRRAWREHARAVAPRFLEIHVATPLSTCAARDPKGLYARARGGEAPHLPGPGAEYEPPLAPDVTASGGEDPEALERTAAAILRLPPG